MEEKKNNEILKINSLCTRAISTTSLREKQFVINELKTYSMELVNNLENLKIENQKKKIDLN